ncbi:MAG: hypothetical protein IPJ37_01990 [Bacteroidales bacterium]|nr:hypothetical protein [Bacteroidales bacterium]
MNREEEISSLHVSSIEEWRDWLGKNCKTSKAINLIMFHKSSKTPSIHWHDAIEQALCYGWVDSKAKRRDTESTYLKFTPRNPRSKWKKENIKRARKMIDQGFMTFHGQGLIDIAKTNGNWQEE